MQSISFGTPFQVGGKTVVGGSATNYDINALVTAFTQSRQDGVKKLEDTVDLNNKKLTALSEYKLALTRLKDATDRLRNVPGFAKASSNAFNYATASVSSSTSTAGSAFLAVSAAPGVAAQSFTVNEITSVAKAKVQTTGAFSIASADEQVVFTTPGTGEFGAGTLAVTTSTGTANITLADGDTLNQVAAKFNAVKTSTGISAGVIKVADGSFKLQFAATSTGTTADFSFDLSDNDYDNVTDNDNVLGEIAISDLQPAAQAVFKINNETIIRGSNTVSDVISGLTFSILQPTSGAVLTVDVQPDTQAAKNAIIDMLNAYNDIRIFSARQMQVGDDGTFLEDSVLFSDTALRSSVNALGNEVSSIVSGLSGSVFRSLPDIGITPTDLQPTSDNPYVRNVLTVDETKLNAALAENFDQVRNVFEFSFVSSSPNLAVYTRSNALAANSFTLNINPGSSTFEATYAGSVDPVSLIATPINGGYQLQGQAGTAFEGLTMLYSSTDSATINVTATQGIADRIYNYVNDATLNTDSGQLTVDINSIVESNKRLQTEIARQNDAIAKYKEQLLRRFSLLEGAVTSVNTLLASLDAQANARNNG